MEFITLTKDDPEFGAHLLGTFSTTHRALPVETYHAATPRERVTFRLVPLEKLTVPAWWRVYLISLRPEMLAITLGPSIADWLSQRARLSEWTRWPSWFALVGVVFLHTAIFLLNDVQDHLRGFDRQNRRRGSQVIQKGWVTTAAMKKWAGLNAALAVVFGVPAFLNAPIELLGICVAALICVGVLTLNRWTRYGLSDIAIFCLFGPLLTSGIALASFGEMGPRDWALGIAFGTLSLWVFQARQLEYLFRSRPAGFRTFLGFCDFDQAKWIGACEGLLLLILQPVVAWSMGVSLKMIVLLPLVSIPLILSIGRQWNAASPLSSSLIHSDRWALASHLTWTLWWILALGVTWL